MVGPNDKISTLEELRRNLRGFSGDTALLSPVSEEELQEWEDRLVAQINGEFPEEENE